MSLFDKVRDERDLVARGALEVVREGLPRMGRFATTSARVLVRRRHAARCVCGAP